jgi:hypothetical protein
VPERLPHFTPSSARHFVRPAIHAANQPHRDRKNMAKSSGYYNVADFNEYKRKHGKCLPPRVNVLIAACYIQEFFDAKKFTYGFMGGLPMLCLGYKREMPDLHIAYDAKDFERLKSKLENNRRYATLGSANFHILTAQDSITDGHEPIAAIQSPRVDGTRVQR